MAILGAIGLAAQEKTFTRQDTLKREYNAGASLVGFNLLSFRYEK